MKMDNLLKGPHVMVSAHSHLPTLAHRKSFVPPPPEENQSPEMYLTGREMRNLAAPKTKTSPIALTCNFCLSSNSYPILICSMISTGRIWTVPASGSPSVSRPPSHACSTCEPPSCLLIPVFTWARCVLAAHAPGDKLCCGLVTSAVHSALVPEV